MRMEQLVKKYNILEPLCLGLSAKSASLLCGILDILYKIIQYYENVFTGSYNRITDTL